MQPVNNRFPKQLRLTANKDISTLFLTGKAFFVYPFRVVYLIIPCSVNNSAALPKMAPSVSKRKFAKAPDRNHIKRLIKESYRTNNNDLLQACNNAKCSIHILYNYSPSEILSYLQFKQAMQSSLQQLIKILDANKEKV